MSTLYVSDLDGTLLQPDARLSEKTVRLLNESVADGKLFTIATARTPATVAGIIKGLDMRVPAIVLTGAALWNPATGHYTEPRFIPEAAGSKLINTFRRNGTRTFVFTLGEDDVLDVYHIGGPLSGLQRQFMEERLRSPYKRFVVDPTGADTLPSDLSRLILFYTMLPDAEARPAYDDARQIDGVRMQCYNDIYGPEIALLDGFAADATKANAVRSLASAVGADRIVCFGDNINDLPMMAQADVSVAVANALPEVREAADIVIGPNTADSVAEFIRNDRG